MYGRNDACAAEIEKLREGDVCHTINLNDIGKIDN